jgi:O-antigen ligase
VKHPIWSRFVGDLTITKYVGAACVVYAIFHLASRTSLPDAFRSPLAKLFTGFYLLALYSFLTKSLPSPWQLSPMLSYSSFLLLFFVTGAVVDSLPRLRWTLIVAIGSLGFASLYVLRELQKFHNVDADIRPGWILGDANYYTLSAVLCIPLALYLARQVQPQWVKLFLYGSLLITLAGVTLGASRGGFLGLMASLVFAAWHSANRLRYVAFLGLLVVPILIIAPVTPFQRLLHPNFSDQEAAQERIVAWKAGLKMIEAHPWTGVGLGNFKPLVTQYEEAGDMRVETLAHNTYIEIAAEMGIPGLLLFLGILFTSMRTLSSVYTEAEDSPGLLRDAALGLQTGLVGAVVGIFFLSCETQKLLWLILFLAPCVHALAAESAEEEDNVDGAPDRFDDAEETNRDTTYGDEYGVAQWG